MATHQVENQAPPLTGYDVYGQDTALVEAVHREGASWADQELRALGAVAGSGEAQDWGTDANRYPPVLHTHDRYGHRRDEVVYHPAYHRLMEVAVRTGQHAALWTDQRPGAHVARAAKLQVWTQVDGGHTCRSR